MSQENGKFVVTGCGRSGTTFTTRILQGIGLDARHEQFFPHIRRTLPGVFYNKISRRYQIAKLDWGEYDCEIAWQAAPFLPWLPGDMPVVHQVRHPLDFIKSRMAKGITYPGLRDRYTRISIQGHRARSIRTAPVALQISYLAEFWMAWNALVEKNARGPYLRVRVESLDPVSFRDVLDHVRVAAKPSEIDAAFHATPRNTNTRSAEAGALDWSELPPDLPDRLSAACSKYGYSLGL